MRSFGDGPPAKRTPSGGRPWGLPKLVSAYLLREAAGAGGTPRSGGLLTL